MSVPPVPERALRRLAAFAIEQALPLWAVAGYDDQARGFHERLQFSGAPIRDVPRRLMVQARQIIAYARAEFAGWHKDGRSLAVRAFESACRRYRSVDDAPGWIFSVAPDGRPVDRTRDLYTHAFVLYMLAWLYRLGSDASILRLADETLANVDRIFSFGKQAGYLSRVPGSNAAREQNPHMHLFEALLALAEVSREERYLARASALVRLFDAALADPVTGTVREVFANDWKPERESGENLVEPGHQMEWSWLLRQWERLGGAGVGDRVARLMTHATSHGIDRGKGLIRNVVQENGRVVGGGSRVWPQTEAIRALSREDIGGKRWPGLVAHLTEGLFRTHLPPDLKGGWIDQVDQGGAAVVDYMPASTLYHLAGAAMDGVALLDGMAHPDV